jgi:ABC-type polysaccharide/polyol phosphate export permease
MTGTLRKRFGYFHRIWELRYFWFSLVQNDLANRYKGSFLGIGWSLVKPLSMTVVYCIIFAKVFKVDVTDFAPFLLIGLTTWQYICECLITGALSFSQGSAYIRQQQVPLAIFPLRIVLGSGFHALIALAVALAVTLFFTGSLHPVGLLCLIPAMLVLLVLGWAMAIVSGVLYTHFPDTRHLLEVALQILFYITPILYKPEYLAGRGRMMLLFKWNPMTSILDLTRTPLLQGTLPPMQQIEMSLMFVTMVALLAFALLRKLERTLVFWI